MSASTLEKSIAKVQKLDGDDVYAAAQRAAKTAFARSTIVPQFTENAKKAFMLRYSQKDETGIPFEEPADSVWRVALNVSSATVLYVPGADWEEGDVEPTKVDPATLDFPFRTIARQYNWFLDNGRKLKEFTELVKLGLEAWLDKANAYYEMVALKIFIPNSPTWTGAGTMLGQLAACFVLPVEDSLILGKSSIMNTLINAVAIQKTGGGNGFSFGRLRPARSIVSTSRGEATGPVGFLGMYNANFEHIRQGGSRRGANMGVLPVWHPDVLKFIFAKVNEGQNANFNISVGLTRKFMEAVKAGDDWEFRFPGPEGPVQEVEWNGEMIKSMPAAELFDIITTNAHKLGDPGALFLDQANDFNPCPKYYVLETTNPCGEQWLGPYENCCLGSIAMSYFVNEAGSFDWAVFQKYVELATEFLDDVVDANTYVESVPQLEEAAQGGRRIGMGQMGLHDALLLQGLRYGRSDGEEFASQVTEFMSYHTMLTSIRRAYARGAFPRIGESIYDPALLKEKGEGATFEGTMTDGTTPFVGRLWSRPTPIISHETDFGRPECDWDNVFEGIVAHGIRNSCQRTFAPTGTIATTAGMEGYGCEPLFALFYIRTVMQEREQIELVYPSQLFLQALTKAGITDEDELVQIAERVKANNGSCQGVEGVPLSIQDIFVVAGDLSGVEHVRMQAVLQAFVDNSISKTINFPKEATIADVAEVYLQAYELGCKGVTIYRQGSRKLEVLSTGAKTGEVEVIDKGHWPLISPLPIPVEAESDGMPSRTYTARTPFGKMRAVFTELEEFPGRPFDIQLSIGRGGSDVNAFTEAIGRLTSLALRAGVPAEAIADQLIGIGGSTQEATLRPDKALSLPDGFGKLMVQHANRESKVVVVEPQKVHDPGLLCPDCNKATVVVAVGCKTCLPELGGCGWSKC